MGRLLVKPGVDFGAVLAPAGARILDVVKRLTRSYVFDVVITSARDGVHSGAADPHHTGEAFDLRTRTLSGVQKKQLLVDLQHELYGPNTLDSPRRFYAFLEDSGGPNEHIHVQRRLGTVYTVLDYLEDA